MSYFRSAAFASAFFAAPFFGAVEEVQPPVIQQPEGGWRVKNNRLVRVRDLHKAQRRPEVPGRVAAMPAARLGLSGGLPRANGRLLQAIHPQRAGRVGGLAGARLLPSGAPAAFGGIGRGVATPAAHLVLRAAPPAAHGDWGLSPEQMLFAIQMLEGDL